MPEAIRVIKMGECHIYVNYGSIEPDLNTLFGDERVVLGKDEMDPGVRNVDDSR